MNRRIDIRGMDKIRIVQALYANAQPQSLGFLHFRPGDISSELAAKYAQGYIDYCEGRVMKVDVTGDTLDPSLYDRDNGDGAALRALQVAGLA